MALRMFFVGGFVFLIGVSVWAIIVVQRLRREHAVAMALLNAIAARAGLQRAVDRLEQGAAPAVSREGRRAGEHADTGGGE